MSRHSLTPRGVPAHQVSRPSNQDQPPHASSSGTSAPDTDPAPSPTPREPSSKRKPPLPDWMASLVAFWVKINNDWIFNLAGLLAYNFLMTVFPILLVLLAAAGAIIGNLSQDALQAFEAWIAAVLPGEIGLLIVRELVVTLTQSVSLLLLVGLVGAFVAGSRLFITLENCFGIVFRLRGRNVVRQNMMAVGMLLLYLLFVPVVFLGTLIPPVLNAILPMHGSGTGAQWLIAVATPVLSVAVTAFAVGMAYIFVPHRPIHWHTWREIWRGAVVAGALLLLYEAFFPWYREHFVHVDNYGSIGAFVIVILLYFYYLALILLVGAEINSWIAGQRETAADIPGMLHAIQAHRTLQGAAGPTAGQPQEEMQVHGPSLLHLRLATLRDRLRARHRRDDATRAQG